jgi:murein L,D-transpeptidase YafK
MNFLRIILVTALLVGLAGCSSKFKHYYGPEVTQIQVYKGQRVMYLLPGSRVLKSYRIGLGGNPVGHKQFEGDQKTPEGAYVITHRNPNSNYHLSLGISYPNEADRAYAAAMGLPPGGDIFIHGAPNGRVSSSDWTVGCIAVTDREMERIYAMVKPGTTIHIFP